ncbi:chaperone protein DnaJ isoform X1 [Triticum aestivum]|uniref:chaperone protein DnaJ isoform X1 n=1 Tax=Triticum aestivum TaxID=4565 RepID=UPI000843883E|nr:chaperone protein DnaJ-like isoform X1 [Triticum aestivum]
MEWHPDKCASGSSGSGGAEAAKARFHKIQAAYAVLSDPNKRILYDVGAYDSDADDEGAGDILGDILEAMNHTPPHQQQQQEDGEGESLEDLHKQFEELFLKPDAYFSKSPPPSSSSSSSSNTRAAGRK